MKLFSFNTNKPTKRKIEIFAALFGCTQEDIIRDAIKGYVDSVTSDYRNSASTVSLSKELAAKVNSKQEETGLSKSRVIDLCLRKYVEENQQKISSITLSIDRFAA